MATPQQVEAAAARCRDRRVLAALAALQGGRWPDCPSPRRQAEINAQVLRAGLPPRVLDRRLRRLGFASGGRLAALSAGAADVRWGRHGRLLLCCDDRAGRAFPELALLAAVNMPVVNLNMGASAWAIAISSPTMSWTNTSAWNLTPVSPTWTITGASAQYRAINTSFANWIDCTCNDGYGTGLVIGNSPFSVNHGGQVDAFSLWNASGWAWVSANAGVADAIDSACTFTISSLQFASTFSGILQQRGLSVSYVTC